MSNHTWAERALLELKLIRGKHSAGIFNLPVADVERIDALLSALPGGEAAAPAAPQDGLLHPAHQVYFRAGLIACREYMARFVESESPTIAMSIRANWWPSLGPDFGPPRQLEFGEVTSGEYGTPDFRVKTAEEVSPTQEALPVAAAFLALASSAPSAPTPAKEHRPETFEALYLCGCRSVGPSPRPDQCPEHSHAPIQFASPTPEGREE